MSERLWAPWRMEYILGEKQGACVFCAMADARPSAFRELLVVHRGAHALVALNKYPFAASHLLVLPRRHVSDVGDLAEGEHDALMRLVRETVARLRAAVRPDGVNVGMNLGKAAGAGIAEHLHAHLVPRWSGDVNFMPVLADVHVMPEHLEASWARLVPFFADLPGERPVDDPGEHPEHPGEA